MLLRVRELDDLAISPGLQGRLAVIEVAPLAEAFGYEYRIASLKAGANPLANPARDISDLLDRTDALGNTRGD